MDREISVGLETRRSGVFSQVVFCSLRKHGDDMENHQILDGQQHFFVFNGCFSIGMLVFGGVMIWLLLGKLVSSPVIFQEIVTHPLVIGIRKLSMGLVLDGMGVV